MRTTRTGFGFFPGQFGMVVYSKYPIAYEDVRTFRKFLWEDMPGNLIPRPFYSPDEVEILRLSSKSHWDVPIQIGRKTVHFLVSHPTPPVFDGSEDRNGRRNHDEIRFWADYITPGKSSYIYDDGVSEEGSSPASSSSSQVTRTPTRSTATASRARSNSCSSIHS